MSANMLFLALTLTVIGGLTAARRIAEPACPSCSAKHWKDEHPTLQCIECGWSSLAPVAVVSSEGASGTV